MVKKILEKKQKQEKKKVFMFFISIFSGVTELRAEKGEHFLKWGCCGYSCF